MRPRIVVIDRSLPAFCVVCEGRGELRLIGIAGDAHMVPMAQPPVLPCWHCGPPRVPVVQVVSA